MPRRRLGLVLLLALLTVPMGCQTRRSELDDQINGLWREGYGYNNPNPARAKKGLPPLNFDGSR